MIKKNYVDTKGGQIHYRHSESGSGIPLVMFHMTPSSSAAFEPMMRELEGEFPMIAFDTVNYGESFRTTVDPSIDFITDMHLEALTNLKIDRFNVYGHHTGANIAVGLALKAPGRVASVIGHGVNYLTMEANAYCAANYAKSNPVHVRGGQIIWAWNKTKDTMGEVIWLNPPNAAAILHRDTVDALRAGENLQWASLAVYKHDLIAALKQVTCPLMIVRCKREPLESYKVQAQALEDLPHARNYLHEEGGVYALETHPADFARETLKFIRETQQTGR